MNRCADETKKNTLYMTTSEVRDVVEHNKERVKIINTGVKAFAKCENKGASCDFRLAQVRRFTD
jgi:tRNA (cytosine34-C5)-methyltransferase